MDLNLCKRMKMEASNDVELVERNPEPQGYSLVNATRVGKHSSTDLIELAREIQNADSYIRATTSSKLQVLVEQLRFIQQQARQILEESKRDAKLHHAACNFKKVPGHIYHLYERPSGQTYFSMLSPQEFGSSCPHEFLGSYRLEHDMSWTPDDKLQVRTGDISLMNQVLQSGGLASLTYPCNTTPN